MLIRLIKLVGNLYSWSLPQKLLIAYRDHGSSISKYLKWFWTTKTLEPAHRQLRSSDYPIVALLLGIFASSIIAAAYLLTEWVRHATPGSLPFALALLLAYPVLMAHLLAVAACMKRGVYFATHPKKAGRELIATILERQVRKLRHRHKFTVVAVSGSVGKTSTKLAVAELLGQTLRVQHQAGNYNDRLTVPLVFFGHQQPALLNVFAWSRLIGDVIAQTQQPYPYDVVVVELGTDGPRQMREFAYIKPDITVITAITPEHMEYFGTLDAVAAEELEVFSFSKRVLVNADDIAGKYLLGKTFDVYSMTTNVAENYYAKVTRPTLQGQTITVDIPSGKLSAHIAFVGYHGAKYALAATAVADMLGLSHEDIAGGLVRLTPFPGRMQVLNGVKDSILIDDAYNATPIAAKAALDVLYAEKAPQRIAILGSMNELGDYAREAHVEVGDYCDAHKLAMVVTVGNDAKRWLAPAAKAKGCTVHSYMSPYDAGNFVRQHLKTGAVVLGKGSQNGVFVEEALKQLLAHPADTKKLVRQSPSWLRTKAKQFN